MRLKTLATVLALTIAVPLGGCQYLCPSCSVSTANPDAMTAAKKALTAAHTLHGTAADVAVALVNSGVLHGSTASTVKTYLDQSENALLLADSAVSAGDATGVSDKVGDAITLINQAEALFAPSKP